MKNLQRWRARHSRTDEDAWGMIVEGTESSPKWIIYPTRELDSQDAALIMAAHNAAIEKRTERAVVCSSITNSKLEPIVEIVIGPEVVHLGIREVRQLITHLQEATEAAMSDALLTRFIRDYVYRNKESDETTHAIGAMLVMFRDFRTAIEGAEEVSPQSTQ